MKKLLTLFLTVMMFLSVATPITASAASRPTADELDVLDVYGYCDYQEAFKCLDKINEYRIQYGRQPLRMDKTMMEIAMCRAAECAVDYSHGRPNGRLSTGVCAEDGGYGNGYVVYDGVQYDSYVFQRSKYTSNTGYTGDNYGTCGGENLAGGCRDGITAANAWYNSEGHRNNFLQSGDKATGIGCFEYCGFSIYIQIFATFNPDEEVFPADYPTGKVQRTFKVEACNVDGNAYANKYSLFTTIMDIEYDTPQYSGQTYYVKDTGDQLVLRIRDCTAGYSTMIIDPSKVTYSSGNPDKVSVDENGIFTVLVNENTTATLYTEYLGKRYPVTITIKKVNQSEPTQKEDNNPPSNEDNDSDTNIPTNVETEAEVAPILNGWQKIYNKWYLYDYGRALSGWQKVNGKWYYLNASGAMQTGWVKSGKKWYYLNNSGVMQTGWQKVNGKWYYLNASGAMQTGWIKLKNKWYYLNASGAMQTGWVKSGKKWYYLNGSGAMQTGWIKLKNKWYYLNGSGAMATGWNRINGKRYYFYSSGALR